MKNPTLYNSDFDVIKTENIQHIKKLNKYRAKPSLLKHCERFGTLELFACAIAYEGKWGDYIAIENVPFTMEEFDEGGQVIYWTNKLLNLTVKVTHVNRYHDLKSIKSIELYQPHCWRNDISFLE